MIQVITLDNSKQWDEIVKSFEQYDTYYLSGYVKAFEINGDGEPLLFYYYDDKCRGINVVMKRNIPESDGLYDFSTPYGYGGWLIEGEDTKKLFKEYENWCERHSIVSEFVRFHPLIGNHRDVEDCYEVVPLGKVITIPIDDKEQIWGNLTSKNRNVIRKAEKNGIEIKLGKEKDIYTSFKIIYNATMDKDNAASYYYFEEDFYDSIREDLKDNAVVFYAVKEGVTIASSIILFSNGKMNYHLSGSLREYSSLAATNLLLYQVCLWGNENGYKTLYLGGGVGSGEDSLYKFKKAFNRNEDDTRFHIGKKIFLKEDYQRLVDKKDDNHNKNFFPEYRG